MKFVQYLGAAALAFAASPASAVVLDFEDLAESTNYSALNYENTTFTSSSGVFTAIKSSSTGTRICANDNPWGCIADLTIDFTKTVENLTFEVWGVNNPGIVGSAEIFLASGGSTIVDLVGPVAISANPQDFSSFGGITGLVLRSTDTLGLTYDKFSFDVVADVPEPSALAGLTFGLGLIGAAAYRRRRIAARG